MEYITEVFLPLELLTVIPPSDHLQYFSALSPLSLIRLFFWVVSLLPYPCAIHRSGGGYASYMHTYLFSSSPSLGIFFYFLVHIDIWFSVYH
ncbi:hypothetical protein BKA82DRAFT_814492 [Pisolithus tinctorius]|uniref:Uncharacterized protein n=1 Tax=Pisolithus tinctorius Marx 270 TaxID=870435 RepID=A0A0C3IRA4_PISTI|nr:hypothetical protein BKA82DRAFT_814492 [Pisolithus tinctorius]KIN99457.1 hypothetical protein M404DRAFT_814492 [Pisolithus tinctorius Marx 270]